MVWYGNKSPPHLVPPDLTARGVRMPTESEIRISNRRVLCVGGGEAGKGKELGKGEEKVKDNRVIEGDRKQPMLIRNILEEGATETDQEGDEKERHG